MYYTFMHLYTKFVTTHLLTVVFTFSDTIMPSTFNNFKNTENNNFFLSNHSYHSLISKNTSFHCPAFPTLSNTHTNGPALALVLHQTFITIGKTNLSAGLRLSSTTHFIIAAFCSSGLADTLEWLQP